MVVSKTSDPIQIKIKIPNPSQGPPGSSKSPNKDLKDKDVLCTFTIKIERPNSKHVCIKDCWPYCYQDQHAKPQSRSSSILQSPKWGFNGQGCSLYLQIQDRSQNLDRGCIKDMWPYPSQYQNAIPNSGFPASSKAPNDDLKDMDVFCTIKIKIEGQNLEHGCIKDKWRCPYHD